MKIPTSKLRLLLALAGTLATLSTFTTTPARADDRDILRDSSTKPYVFILLDTSGSMNWSPKCTAAQVAAGQCTFLCPTGDCKVPRDGDDPASKFRQAKEAIYDVLQDVTDLNIGFATYNSDDLAVGNKHWMYRVAATQPAGFFSLAGTVAYPVAGSNETFGTAATCTAGTGDGNVACGANGPADTNNAWEYERYRRIPRLGVNGSTSTTLYLRVPTGPTVYKVTYSGTVTYGNNSIAVTTVIVRCTNASCSSTAAVGSKSINYERVGDFIGWENGIDRTDPNKSYLGGAYGTGGQDSTAGNFCSGWDPNSDTSDDQYTTNINANIKRRTAIAATLDGNPVPYFVPTGTDAAQAWRFQYGDIVPLSWVSQNTQLVLNRLAPRMPPGALSASDPEAFANATYLKDLRAGGENYLQVKDLTQKPLIPTGSTPLYNSIAAFRSWYRGCNDLSSCSGGTGWDDFAATHDSQWGCRQKYLLVITDGDETCPTPAASDTCKVGNLTGALNDNDDVHTIVVGYGVDSASSNQLNCMALRGGTLRAAPYYPQNKAELVADLRTAFDSIKEESAAFASAAVPQVQANATDKIFLSSFTPIKEVGFWAGRMDSFLKPLPVDIEGRPDRTILCDSDTKASCFLWDAGDVQEGLASGGGTYNPQGLLLQAPNAYADGVDTDPPFDAAELQLGTAADERRVVYSQFYEGGNRKLFTYPATNSQKYDLWNGMGIPYIVGNTASETAADERANAVITEVLLEKEGDIPDPTDNTLTIPITYLLGDIFHADPLVFNKPANFTYYTSDPYLNKPLCGAAADPNRSPPPSYKWFADRNVCRRTLLLTAANDGQLHAFDAGIFRDPSSGSAECLLPAKDLDGDGVAETDEYSDGIVDYDYDDAVESDTEHVVDGAYDNGSGKEVFSFIPRAMLKPVLTLVEEHDRNKGPWGIDGSPRVDDVFIDPLASENGSTACLDREWRSVLLGGYREGGPGYYALDITQPDTLDNTNVPEPTAGYTPSCFDGNADCANRPYPSVLWEFQDEQSVQVSAGIFINMQLDEDLNNERDLGNSWSKMTTGRIRVCTGGLRERRDRGPLRRHLRRRARQGSDGGQRQLYLHGRHRDRQGDLQEAGDRLGPGRCRRRRLERRLLPRPALFRHHRRLHLQGPARNFCGVADEAPRADFPDAQRLGQLQLHRRTPDRSGGGPQEVRSVPDLLDRRTPDLPGDRSDLRCPEGAAGAGGRHRQPLESLAGRRPGRPVLRPARPGPGERFRRFRRYRPRRRAQHHLRRLQPAAHRVQLSRRRARRRQRPERARLSLRR